MWFSGSSDLGRRFHTEEENLPALWFSYNQDQDKGGDASARATTVPII